MKESKFSLNQIVMTAKLPLVQTDLPRPKLVHIDEANSKAAKKLVGSHEECNNL